MGTRGSFGVRVGELDKLMYNHFDSYPSGLGDDLIKQYKELLKEHSFEEIKQMAITLDAVDEDKKPTAKQKKAFKKYTNLGVSNQSDDDWYCLVRDLQGQLDETLKLGLYLPAKDFILDSLFCEWAYIFNFDTKKLEIYKGFQKEVPKGRYYKEAKNDKYYACSLIMEYDLNNLPDNLDVALEEILVDD